jgi:ABC-type phosphate transport system auxiliary subunit
MSVPALGGLLWIKYGHPWVFVAAAAVAVVMFVFSSMVRTPGHGAQANA